MFSVLKQKLVKKKKGGSKAKQEEVVTPEEPARLCTPKEMKYLLNIDY